MENEILVRVINKNKQGALVQSLHANYQELISWDEFDKYFTPTEQEYIYKCTIPQEQMEKIERQKVRIQWMHQYIFQILTLTNPNRSRETFSVTDLATLGTIVRKYNKEFPDTSMDTFIEDTKVIRAMLSAI